MAFRTLRARLLAVQSLIVIVLTAATLAYVSLQANQRVNARIAQDLARSRQTIGRAQAGRTAALTLVAQLVASFPEFRQLLMTRDEATIRDYLSTYLQQNGRSELLVAVDTAGQILARSDSFARLTVPSFKDRWVDPAVQGKSVVGQLEVDGHVFDATAAPVEAGGTIYGIILALAPVDAGWATELREVSDMEIAILGPREIVGSTIAAARLPWTSAPDLDGWTDDAPHDVVIGGERFQAIALAAAPGRVTRLVSLQSRDAAFAPYRSIQIGLLVLGIAAAAAGIAASALFARTLTTPIGRLAEATRHVAAGRYDTPVELARADELGQLATAFNAMTAGLRERADMQKFVSHSTVEMIQRRRPAERRDGERCVLTLLFCDIRGFTAFSERRSPEEAVRVLNRHLHAQADLVKRFSGDVDKFIGDAVFAHFAGPDMALNAIRCAVEIQRATANAHGADPNDPDNPALAVGIGIATGDVIVGSVGSDDRLDHTAIGASVNLAARLCSAAEPHEILIGEATFLMVKDLVAAEPVPPLSVKGFSEPMRAYRMKRS